MNRSRLYALVLLAVLVATAGYALAASGGGQSPGGHRHDLPPMTYEEAKRIYNPNNSPYTKVVDNGDGTFTITFQHPVAGKE